MRVGLHCRSAPTPQKVEVILDWPEKSKPKPFITEYFSGWKHGRSGEHTSATDYHSGPLRSLGFSPSPTFSVTSLDPRLQLADMVVGASREFIDYALGKRRANQFGVREATALLPNFYADYNRKILGRGLSISPTTSDLRTAVETALERHGFA